MNNPNITISYSSKILKDRKNFKLSISILELNKEKIEEEDLPKKPDNKEKKPE